MYFIPAALATATHSSASNLVGLNRFANLAYSARGISLRRIIHSATLGPIPGSSIFIPSYTPPRVAYKPQ